MSNFQTILVLGIFVNTLLYIIKYICKKSGYSVNYINHLRDLSNFIQIIKSEDSMIKKFIYSIIIIISFISVVLIIVLIL